MSHPDDTATPPTGEDVVRRTAALARLSIDAEETRRLAGDFARILAAFQVLEEVDLADSDDAPPPRSAAPVPRRADEPAPFADVARLLDAAPEAVADDGGRFFGVPKTLGGPA